MKKLAAIGPLGFLIISGASAQQTITTPFTVRGGWSYLPNSSAGDLGKKSGYTFGIGYDFLELKKMHARVGVDIDFSNNDGNGNKIETGSVQLVGRAPFTLPTKGGPEFYYGVGVGVYKSLVSSSSSTFTGSQTITSSNSDTLWTGGGELLLGARIATNYGVEIYYRIVPSNSGVQPSTLGAVVAIHF